MIEKLCGHFDTDSRRCYEVRRIKRLDNQIIIFVERSEKAVAIMECLGA